MLNNSRGHTLIIIGFTFFFFTNIFNKESWHVLKNDAASGLKEMLSHVDIDTVYIEMIIMFFDPTYQRIVTR